MTTAVLAATDLSKAGGALRQFRAAFSKTGTLGNTDTTGISDGVATSETSRDVFMSPPYQVSDIQLCFSNIYINSSGEAVTTNDITVQANVEIAGVSYPLFQAGRRNMVLEPGAVDVPFDPLAIDIPANTAMYYRVYVSVSSGGVWPRGRFGRHNRAGGITAGANSTAAIGTLPNDQGQYIYGPSLVLGRTVGNSAPSVLVVGDSLVAGQGDTGDANGAVGFAERALTGVVGYTTLTKSGYLMTSLTNSHTRSLARCTQFCSSAILELGSNDIFGSHVNLATMQSRAAAGAALLKNRGLKVFMTTIMPRSSGGVSANPTDSATTAAYNDWLRLGQSFMDGLFDIADICETTRNSGLWKPALQPGDGIHPNGAGYATISAGIITSQLV
jgi:lysophospholipase L1-like esterase